MKQSTKAAEIRVHFQCHNYLEQLQMIVHPELLLSSTLKFFISLTRMSQNIKQRTEKKLPELVLLLYSKERQTCCFSGSTCLLVK